MNDSMFTTNHDNNNKKEEERQNERKKAIKWIRKNFVCHKCQKYPGDDEWSFGSWHNGPYTCFDCT